jgi:hypothetical protein
MRESTPNSLAKSPKKIQKRHRVQPFRPPSDHAKKMSGADKTKQAAYDSAADSDLELEMEQKSQPPAKVNPRHALFIRALQLY